MKLRFRGKQKQLDNIYSFMFEPIDLVGWVAGQSIKLELPAGYGMEEKRFSISSAPFEDVITITTKVSDSIFKQALDALRPGQEVNAYSVEGDFVWAETPRKRVLCASGIGITPIYSILKQLQHDKQPMEALLLYANHDDKFVFGAELKKISRHHPELKITWLPSQRLTANAIKRNSPNLSESLVYLSGPSAMVDEVGADLLKIGLPKDSLRQDWFTGRPGWRG